MTTLVARVSVASAIVLSLAALPAFAQPTRGGRCVIEFPPESNVNTRASLSRTPSGGYNQYLGGGMVAVCRAQGMILRADSAEYYADRGLIYLIGNVHYTEPRTSVDSDRMTYWQNEERLVAEGNVVATMPSGTRMRGPRAEYFRPAPAIRPRSRMVATGRPTVTLVQADSAGRSGEPVTIVANQVVTEADSLVYATGRVEITRPDLLATSDSAFLDSGREFARLIRAPSITGRGERPFTLRGRVIDIFSRNRTLERVVAAGNGRAESEDIDLVADTIDLRLAANRLQRAYAWGRSRARATSPTQDIVADSIDVAMPGQTVREVHAVGQAFAEAMPDSTRILSTERDWLRGDTIVARFDSVPASDTASRPRIRELLASGNASSLYQIATSEGRENAPAMNYVRGRTIEVDFENQAVHTVTVTEQAVGLYLAPVPSPGGAAPPAPSDTTRTTPPRRRPAASPR